MKNNNRAVKHRRENDRWVSQEDDLQVSPSNCSSHWLGPVAISALNYVNLGPIRTPSCHFTPPIWPSWVRVRERAVKLR